MRKDNQKESCYGVVEDASREDLLREFEEVASSIVNGAQEEKVRIYILGFH